MEATIRKFKFQMINIKLQTNKFGENKTNAYKNLIKKLKEGKVHSSVEKNIHMMIFSCFERATAVTKTEYIYGRLGKGIHFDKDTVDTLNIEKAEEEKIITNKNQILDPDIAEYIFIPSIHRFIFLNVSGISIKNVYKFLKENLPLVADKEDIVEVDIVKDPKITEEILNAFQIHFIDYNISYTNDDITSSAEKYLDEHLKKLNVGTFKAQLKADHNGALNTKEPDELIEGGIKLAEQNGQINEAVITRYQGGDKERLTNKENPRYFDVDASDDNYRETIISKVLRLFRKDE